MFDTLWPMNSCSNELELPFGDASATDLAIQRFEHLLSLTGLEPEIAPRLARAFPSLAAIYRAPESELSNVIGPVSAARIRWFLDAPLNTALAVVPPATATRRAA